MDYRLTYYSTNLKAPAVTFKEALLNGLAPDGGLYMPVYIPQIGKELLESFHSKSYPEIAADILDNFMRYEISKNDLLKLCRDVYSFSIPLENVFENKYIMRLDQGPTASFKDFAALLMGRIMQHFLKDDNRFVTVLTATSGDTGSAVANAFYGLSNIEVIILYPDKEISLLQRKQMTTLQGNVRAIAIKGKFDDCQKLAKRAFMDSTFKALNLSSANSINIGRLLPQSVFYFWAWAKTAGKSGQKIVFSVPSGNFGNVAGGFIAKEMGLPVKCFVISTNENDEVPEYLRTGIYRQVVPSKNCISSAMNVGHPSNLSRIIALYSGVMDENGSITRDPDLEKLRRDTFAVSISDAETEKTISECYRNHGFILEPHGAVAWNGLHQYLKVKQTEKDENTVYVSLETAHPAKFREEISRILNIKPALPESLVKAEEGNEEIITLENNYEVLKDYITTNY